MYEQCDHKIFAVFNFGHKHMQCEGKHDTVTICRIGGYTSNSTYKLPYTSIPNSLSLPLIEDSITDLPLITKVTFTWDAQDKV